MKQKQILMLTGILAIVVIILYVVYPSEDLSGSLVTCFTINYVDGTSREVDPMSKPLSLVVKKMSVTDSSNNPISDICWSAYAKLSWSGDISSKEVSGTINIVDVSGTTRQTYSFTKTDLISGTKKLLMSRTIGASTLEQWASGSSGSVTVKVTSTAKITASDGESKSKSATGQSTFSYKVSSPSPTLAITDFSVTSYISTYTDPGPW